MDFSKPHRRNVQWFGMAVGEAAHAYGIRDAMAVLADTAARTYDEDMRHDRLTLEALDYLRDHTTRPGAATAYQAALSVQDPDTRRQAVTDAYNALCRVMAGAATIRV